MNRTATVGGTARQRSGDNILEVRQIEVVYNRVQIALAGVSLAVRAGEAVGLLGLPGHVAQEPLKL